MVRRWRIRLTKADAVTCVSVRQCTAVGSDGREVTFNPNTGGTTSNSQVETVPQSDRLLYVVACPSRTQCTAIFRDSTGLLQGYEVTFDPISGTANAAGVALVGGESLRGLSCASTSQCTVVDPFGREVTFDPRTAQPNAAGQVAFPHASFEAVSCPSLDQCTATEPPGFELTFDPATGTANDAGLLHFRTGKNGTLIDCPSANQCTAVGSDGREATFNPSSGVGTVHLIDH
jgi:hypothetical protein